MLGAKCGIQGQSRHIDSAISYRKVVTNQIGSSEGGDGRRHVEGAVEVLEDGTRQGASMHFAARDADGFLATIPQFHERDIPGRTRTFVKFIDFIPNLQKRLDVRHVRHSQIRGGR